MNSVLDQKDSAEFEQFAVHSMPIAARSVLVNRTHRVVRERAKVMQQKRSRERSLMLPLIICSSLLILTALAIWTGLYQYQVVEAAQSDAAGLTDSNDHSLVVLLWFVPVFVAFLATIWVRRSRPNADDEAR